MAYVGTKLARAIITSMNKPLPPDLKFLDDPKRIAEDLRLQEIRQAGFSRARLTEAERLVQQGSLIEETARGNIIAAEGDEEALQMHRSQLAHGLALQGRYGEAAQHHPDEAMRADYVRIADAIQRPDDEKCDCPDDETDTLTITPRFSERTVMSVRHGGAVQLVTCRKCGHTNARPARSRLLVQSAAMNQNLAMAKGQSERGRIPDAVALKKPDAGT